MTEDSGKKCLIAHVIYRFGMGGLENGLVNIINRLPEDEFQHAIICMTEHDDFSKRLNKPVQIFDMHKKPGKDLKLYYRLWRLLKTLKPDIVHSRNMSALEAQLPAFLAGVPIRIHGEHGRDVHDLDGSNKRYQMIRKFFRTIIDYYIPLSKELECYLRTAIQVDHDKIITICNGVDIDKFQYNKFVGEKIPGLPDDFLSPSSILIGTVGRLEAVKDQSNLLEGFIRLLKRSESIDKDIKLLIVGEGSMRGKIKKRIKEAGIEAQVWLPGGRDDVPEIMNLMSIFVLPSNAEGISNTILEAMACTLPVIATNVGGNAELVIDDETGFIVPASDPDAIADKILRYIEMPELIQDHGQSGRKRIEEQFSIASMVDKYYQVYVRSLKEKDVASCVV